LHYNLNHDASLDAGAFRATEFEAPLKGNTMEATLIAMPDATASAQNAPAARPPRQPKVAAEETMPTPEQVQKSMAKALRMYFQDECPHQAERSRQLTEGRRLAASEGFAPLKHMDERQMQIRAGQSAAALEARGPRPAPSIAKTSSPTAGSADKPAGAKKPRSRNRNRKPRQLVSNQAAA
jgi:hypothetical protein